MADPFGYLNQRKVVTAILHPNALVAISICEFGKSRLFDETAELYICRHMLCTHVRYRYETREFLR
jgi:hypothetical protein